MSQPASARSYDRPSAMPEVAAPPPVVTRCEVEDPERSIVFPQGLLGFAGQHRYQLTEIPGVDVPFKLLRSAENPELRFVVLPLDANDGPIAGADLAAARRTLTIADGDLAVLAIVTLRAAAERIDSTINLRAPLLVDTGRALGWQHVLPDDAYPLRHPLPRAEPGHGG